MKRYDERVEVRTFRIRDSRVHAAAPGRVDDSDQWRIYYSTEPVAVYPVKIVDGGTTIESAIAKALQLADLFN